jgi:hypothetical protein
MDISNLNMADTRLRRLRNILREYTNVKKMYKDVVNEQDNYNKQLTFYNSNRTTSNLLASKVREHLAYFLLDNRSASFNNNNFKLEFTNDARITTIGAWCSRNKVEHLIDEYYYINFDDGTNIFGKRDKDTIDFNPNLMHSIVLKLRKKINSMDKDILNVDKQIQKHIKDIKDIFKEQKEVDTVIIKRNKVKIENMNEDIQKLQEKLAELQQNKIALATENTKKQKEVLDYETAIDGMINKFTNIYKL